MKKETSMKSWTSTDEAWGAWPQKDRKDLKVRIYRLPDGTFQGIPAVGQIPKGAERLSPQPKPPPGKDPREGKKKVMAELESRYPQQVNLGCYWAVRIAQERLRVHSRDLWERLITEKLVDPVESTAHWLGAVFHRLQEEKILRKTNSVFKYTDSARGVHERTIPIWELIDGADTSKYDVPPRKD